MVDVDCALFAARTRVRCTQPQLVTAHSENRRYFTTVFNPIRIWAFSSRQKIAKQGNCRREKTKIKAVQFR